jgi:hypothetical protein
MSSNIANSLYDGSADLGKTYATGQMLCGVIIFIILCLCGLYNIITPPTSANVTATILNVNSVRPITSNKTITFSCNLKVKYLVKNKEYINNVTLRNQFIYTSGQNVDISYELNNPNNISAPSIANDGSGSGYSSIVSGCLLLCSCGINFYMAHNNKLYAASTGVGNSVGILNNAF